MLWTEVPPAQRMEWEWLPLLDPRPEWAELAKGQVERFLHPERYCPVAVKSMWHDGYYQPCAVRTADGRMCLRHRDPFGFRLAQKNYNRVRADHYEPPSELTALMRQLIALLPPPDPELEFLAEYWEIGAVPA